MRVTLKIDSASATEAEAFIYSYQRAYQNLLLDSPGDCTVQMMGAWHVTTPPITPHHARTMSEDFFGWLNERDAARLTALLDPPTTQVLQVVRRGVSLAKADR